MNPLLLLTAMILISSHAQTLSGSTTEAGSDSGDTAVTGSLFIHGGWLFDGISDTRRRNSGILIREGKIAAIDVPETSNLKNESDVIELADTATILPGLIDLHAHYKLDFIDR